METLTKETFWNDLMSKYPERMKAFCDWIDEYKKTCQTSNDGWFWLKNDFQARPWDKLFNNDIHGNHFNGEAFKPDEKRQDVKFHDLPVAMQFGVFMQFVHDADSGPEALVFSPLGTFSLIIQEWFRVASEKGPLTMQIRVLEEAPADGPTLSEVVSTFRLLRYAQKDSLKAQRASNSPQTKANALQKQRAFEEKADLLLEQFPYGTTVEDLTPQPNETN